MIFPEHCKHVGVSDGARPCRDRVYFLTRYLVVYRDDGEIEIRAVETAPGPGFMRDVRTMRVIAGPGEVAVHPDPVVLHDRGRLIGLALQSASPCTLFVGRDEHVTFVLDPDPAALTTIHVYDCAPPRPHLSETIRELEATGIFGAQPVRFVHHVMDIRKRDPDVYPCRASGFPRSVDRIRVAAGERVAGCRTTQELIRECGNAEHHLENICPLDAATSEPFIARCCRSERCGLGTRRGLFGGAVHWGASPWEIAGMVMDILEKWEEHAGHRSG